QGQLAEAAGTYEQLERDADVGASYAASGLGDLAMYEGRLADAARIFEAGASADLAARDTERAASKLNALAEVQAMRGDMAAAVASADRALANSQAAKIQ